MGLNVTRFGCSAYPTAEFGSKLRKPASQEPIRVENPTTPSVPEQIQAQEPQTANV